MFHSHVPPELSVAGRQGRDGGVIDVASDVIERPNKWPPPWSCPEIRPMKH